MNGARAASAWTRRLLEQSPALALLLVVDLFAYVAGLTLWYGPVMGDPATPVWVWPFVPDCPLFGLLGGLALLMMTAQRAWSENAQRAAQRWLVAAGAGALAVGIVAYVPGGLSAWRPLAGMWSLLGVSLLLCGLFFRRTPAWVLCVLAAGQIKYGIWTITAWALFWRNSAVLFGSPLFSPDSILMTISHVGLALQGVLLLTYIRPNLVAALATWVWFGASDLVDYRLGWHPAVSQLVPVSTMEWSTVAVTLLLGAGLAGIAIAARVQIKSRSGRPGALPLQDGTSFR